MRCEVLFVKVIVVGDDDPETMVLHQFTKSRKFTIGVPLLIGFSKNVSDYVSMIMLAMNKRANLDHVEFFVHQEHALVLDTFINYRNYLVVNYETGKRF